MGVVINIANTNLLCSYHGEVCGHFAFLYVQFICASGIKLCMPGYPAVLAWLCLQVWSKCAQIHVLLFFHKDETTMHLPHNIRQSMHYSYVQSWKPAVTGCSNSQHRDQYSRWRHGTTFLGQQTSYHALHVLLHMCKSVSTLNFDFSNVYWKNNFPCRKY